MNEVKLIEETIMGPINGPVIGAEVNVV